MNWKSSKSCGTAGPSTVREVMDVLNEVRPRAYTSVMSLLNVMTEKRLVVREPQGRAFVYRPKTDRGRTLRRMVGDLAGPGLRRLDQPACGALA